MNEKNSILMLLLIVNWKVFMDSNKGSIKKSVFLNTFLITISLFMIFFHMAQLSSFCREFLATHTACI